MTMRILPYLSLAVLLLGSFSVQAQSKTELQASIATLTAKNDSLSKQLATATDQNTKYARLIDTLSVMTGVHVDDLDTVKTVMQLRAAARTANADSLTRSRSQAARLQMTVDSLTKVVTRLRADSAAMATPAMVTTTPATVAPTSAKGAATSKTDQLMKLNSMFEQGLLTKDEFLKLKQELMGK